MKIMFSILNKKILIGISILFLFISYDGFLFSKIPAKKNPFTTEKQKISYAFGALQAGRLQGSIPGFIISVDFFEKGMIDFDKKNKMKIEEKDHASIYMNLQALIQKKMQDDKFVIPEKDVQDISYVIGISLAKNIESEMGNEIDLSFIAKGYSDALQNKPLLMTEKELETNIDIFQKKYDQPRKKEDIANFELGKKYTLENKKKKGVKETPTGIQYNILVDGKGNKPNLNDSVKVHYKGTLVSGEEFDSSYKRNEPAVFPLTSVIAGWTEILQMMSTGSKWQVVIPHNLAYGKQDAGTIKPYSTLIFEIELLEVIPQKFDSNEKEEKENHDGHDH